MFLGGGLPVYGGADRLLLAHLGVYRGGGAVACGHGNLGGPRVFVCCQPTRSVTACLLMSDAQMASVVGGELGNSLQTFGLPSADQLSEQLTRILNQALTARPGDQSKATSVETQKDGTIRIIAQEGNETITIIIPFPLSPQALLSAVPFQSLASVGQNIVQAINELSGPVLGAPATALRLHR